MKDNELHSIVDATYMNRIPFKSREQGKKLLRDYSLDELIKLKLFEDSTLEFKQANVNIQQWVELINFVILTKLSGFRIHHNLEAIQLRKLASITASCLEKNSKNLDEVLTNLDDEAVILKKWVQQIQYFLQTKQTRR
jgi:hypothetical protein